MAVVVAVALGLGGDAGRLAFAAVAGYLVLVHSITLLAGLAGHLTVAGAATGLGLTLVGALALARHPRVDHSRPLEAPRFSLGALVVPSAAIVALGAWAWPQLFHATRLWVWDDYTYHMVYPALWRQARAIAAATPVQAFTMQAWYPLSASVVSTWLMLPFEGAREALAWVSLTGVLYAALVAAGAVELGARLGCRHGAWAVPVVLFATSSRTAVMASSFSDADLAQATALFAAFVFAVPRGDDESRRDVAADTWCAALLSGLSLGVKVSAAPQALIVLLMTALRAVTPAAGTSARVPALLRTVLVFTVGWTATAGYWYARNVVHTGNPVYPAAFLVWPGATFPETTLFEYGRRYGVRRAIADALTVYANWPPVHAVLAALGLLGLAGWLLRHRGRLSRPGRYFAWGGLAIAAVVLTLLPGAPYSAGNALTFRSGLVHWDSLRYVALLPLVGWTGLGVVLDAGAGASRWRTLAAILVAAAAWLAPGNALPLSGVVALVLILAALVATRSLLTLTTGKLHTRGRWLALAGAAVVVAAVLALTHHAKTAATEAALGREPLFGTAAAVLDAQPPGTRIAVFGDQWIWPAFGGRGDLHPIRLDRDGHLATAPIGAEMEPGDLGVDAATFRDNLRASGIDVVVLVRQPHPGRPWELPTQHAALEATPDAQLLHRDRAVAIWRLGK